MPKITDAGIFQEIKNKTIDREEGIRLLTTRYPGMKQFIKVVLATVEADDSTPRQASDCLKYEYRSRRGLTLTENIDETD